jgi:hypothetical protein
MMIEMMHGIAKEKDIAAATAILHACFLDRWLTVCSPVDRLIHPLQMLLYLCGLYPCKVCMHSMPRVPVGCDGCD